MAVIFELKERRVIPNWRDFKRTLQLGELEQSNKSIPSLTLSIDRSLLDWIQNRNIGNAADLVSSSFVSGIFNQQVMDAVEYVKANKRLASKSLIEMTEFVAENKISKSNSPNTSLLEVDVDSINEFQAFVNNKAFHRIINKTKNRARKELTNPIIWVELARLYSMRGHIHKAEKAILTALNLAPDNRFVLRSATRFYIHHELFDRALYYLKQSNRTKLDPWLISAQIATSSIVGRFSPLINVGKKMVDSGHFSDFELTELTSSLGTLEFSDGSYKKAKRFFEKSMKDPNDNSLAQLEWVSKDDKRFQINPFQFEKVINPFEARALELFERGQWQDAFYNSIKWFLDMPFSKRPALLGSYIAGSLLKDKNAAVILCQAGLQANPRDPTLLNNIVYSLATSNDTGSLDNYFRQMMEIDISTLSNETKITFQATLGLVALKSGDSALGIRLYELAIKNADRLRNNYLKNLAIANFANELINLNISEKDKYVDLVRKIKVLDDQKDLQLLVNDVISKIET